MRVLLAEDDRMIAQALCEGLAQNALIVDWVEDGEKARRALSASEVDYAVLLLDLGLPRRSKNNCTDGTMKSRAMRWMCIFTIYAKNWVLS